jgi:hypothetical protein
VTLPLVPDGPFLHRHLVDHHFPIPPSHLSHPPSSSIDRLAMNKKASVSVDGAVGPIVEPHPAEDLSADDDLLSWILVDQLGALPNTRLGVHPQQVKFVGPAFKNEEIMDIVKEVSAESAEWSVMAGRTAHCC